MVLFHLLRKWNVGAFCEKRCHQLFPSSLLLSLPGEKVQTVYWKCGGVERMCSCCQGNYWSPTLPGLLYITNWLKQKLDSNRHASFNSDTCPLVWKRMGKSIHRQANKASWFSLTIYWHPTTLLGNGDNFLPTSPCGQSDNLLLPLCCHRTAGSVTVWHHHILHKICWNQAPKKLLDENCIRLVKTNY